MRSSLLAKLTALVLCAILLVAGSSVSVISINAATPAPVPITFTFSMPDPSLMIDAQWYRQRLIVETDLWNGGLDGKSGMGAYDPDFNGCFNPNLDRQWRTFGGAPVTVIFQSRAIYMNVEAYRADPDQGQRFLDVVNKGVDCLLKHFRDGDKGGFFWAIHPQTFEVTENQKQGYGNVHPLFALAQAYEVTSNPDHLAGALEQLKVLQEKFLDPQYPGGIRPGFNTDFSEIEGVNNVDTFTHYFEALLALYDVAGDALRAELEKMITLEAEFLINQLYTDQEDLTDRGYVAYNYDLEWNPSQEPYTRQTQWSGAKQASTGHNVELAYLLSRAVERGFDPGWLDTAAKLLKFCQEYTIDPRYGGMIYEVSDYDGSPLEGNPDNELFVWWAQLETARALMHFAIVRDWDTDASFKQIEAFILEYFTDHQYGGLYANIQLTASGASTTRDLSKGNIWKANYHFTMFMREALRLAEAYPDRIKELVIR